MGKISPPVLIAAALLLPLSGYLIVWGRFPAADDGPGKRRPPALFDEVSVCSLPDSALHRAREAEAAAAARMQRYPFASSDGIRAVQLSAETQRCYELAGRNGDAARLKKQLRTWKQKLDQDYRSRRLRLRLSLQNRNQKEALREVRALQKLLSHRNDSYTSWLDDMERHLAVNRQTATRPE
jgi:hypothetical protein